MGRVAVKLSELKIKSSKCKDKDYKMYDGNGLHLLIKKNGRKVWRVTYRFNKKERTITLGDYPALSLKEARVRCMQIRQKVIDNIDPLQERKVAKNSAVLTFKDIANKFLDLKEDELSTSHYFRQKRRLEMYIFPYIGDKNANSIEKIDIIDLINKIDKNKNETARRIFTLIKQIYRFGVHSDLIKEDIASKIDINAILPKKKSKNIAAITNLEDIRVIFKLLDSYDNNITKNALKFLALTALRPGNVRNLKWEYVDWQRDVIIFPKEAMKAKKEFRLPLTNTLLKILKETYIFTKDAVYVFTSPLGKSRQLSENTLNYAHKRLGIENHTSHSWRSAFSTNAYENIKKHGFSAEVIEAQLHHAFGTAVTRAYMRSDFLEERKELLEWWESILK